MTTTGQQAGFASRSQNTSLLLDLVIDASRERDSHLAAIIGLLKQTGLQEIAERVSVLLPPDTRSGSDDGQTSVQYDAGPEGFARAIANAVEGSRHLLVVSAATLPGVDCVGRLLEAFALDPMIGFALPRFATPDGSRVFPLPADQMEGAPGEYARRLLSLLPEIYLCPEVLAGVVLLRRETLTGLKPVEGEVSSVSAALLTAMIEGRRLGFRAAIVNRAIAPAPSREAAYPALDVPTTVRIARRYPCHTVARSSYGDLSAHRREALLSMTLASPLGRRRLLLDVRGLTGFHSGTSSAILGMLQGLVRLPCDWSVDVLATAQAARFHDLPGRCPEFRVIFDKPHEFYNVALRLSQPWDIQSLADLHAHALKIAVNMLDTIMWDIIYLGNPEVAWNFAATYLDGLLYISDYTRRRFNFRFPTSPRVRQSVSYLSFNGADYRGNVGEQNQGQGADILIFGNGYDHKWVAGALELIADAFPLNRIAAIGLDEPPRPNVQVVPSGMLEEREIDWMYGHAKILCYPSFYEGFGLPIVKGLAYGLDVVARRSDLLEEVASLCSGPGRILPFDDPLSLIESIGRALAGVEVETLALGIRIPEGEAPMTWRDVAARIIALVDDLAADVSTDNYDSREAALRIISPRGHEGSELGLSPVQA